MSETEDFCRRYMAQWDKRSLVRAKTRFELSPGFDRAEIVNARLVAGAGHPKVTGLGPEACLYLKMQHCYDYLDAVASGEAELIAKVAIDFGFGEGDGLLPKAARQALLTLATDETYHAYSARELIEVLEQATGVERQPPSVQNVMTSAAEVTFAHAPDEILPFARLMVVGLMENAITDELVELIKGRDHDSPFYDFNRIHLQDEACHRAFFRVALRCAWQWLNRQERELVSELLPVFLGAYILTGSRGDDPVLRARLAAVGMPEADIEAVIRDVASVVVTKDTHPFWINVRKCLDVTGMLDDDDLAAGLVAAGWPLKNQPMERAA